MGFSGTLSDVFKCQIISNESYLSEEGLDLKVGTAQ